MLGHSCERERQNDEEEKITKENVALMIEDGRLDKLHLGSIPGALMTVSGLSAFSGPEGFAGLR
jgi:hypothetical protein